MHDPRVGNSDGHDIPTRIPGQRRNPVVIDEITHVNGRPLSQQMPSGHHDVKRLAVQRKPSDPHIISGPVLLGDGQIDLPVQQQRQTGMPLDIPNHKGQLRRTAPQRSNSGRHHLTDGRRETGNLDLPSSPRSKRRQGSLRPLQLSSNSIGVPHQQLPSSGQRNPPPPPPQQRLPSLSLKGSQLLRHSRRRQVQRLPSRGHGPVISQRPQHRQPPRINHPPILTPQPPPPNSRVEDPVPWRLRSARVRTDAPAVGVSWVRCELRPGKVVHVGWRGHGGSGLLLAQPNLATN